MSETEAMSKTDYEIVTAKKLRVSLDTILQELKTFRDSLGRGEAGRHAALSVTHTEDAIMRLGMVLKSLNVETPYPNSYNPTNTVVEPTADGLKF